MTDNADLTRWATWTETHAQPRLWRDWSRVLDVDGLRGWVAEQSVDEVWFCGAGTSAYIGDILVSGLEGQGGPRLRAVPSTDLVARPQAYLRGRRPLVVNFGRSGNSSETVGTLDALDVLAPSAPRLNITCNPDGVLATRGGAESRVVLLPPETHDAGFAMTSSFSTMLLTALMVFAEDRQDPDAMNRAATTMEAVLPEFAARTGARPDRAVFLGTGPLAYAAREAALKVMELTAGQVPCLWDSVLGFRHGPKSFTTQATRIVILTDANDPACRYEADLVAELRAQYPDATVTAIGPGGDIDLPHPDGPLWAAPIAIGFAQVAGVIWADGLGLNVDDPFSGQGTLSRVVSGVTLYEVAP